MCLEKTSDLFVKNEVLAFSLPAAWWQWVHIRRSKGGEGQSEGSIDQSGGTNAVFLDGIE